MTKQLLGIIILSVVTVVFWIGLEVWTRIGSKELEVDYQDYLQPVQSEFDAETLEELLRREDEYMMATIGDLE